MPLQTDLISIPQQPLSEGMQAAMDHDLIMWLTKDLAG